MTLRIVTELLCFLLGLIVALLFIESLDRRATVLRVGDHLKFYGRRVRITKIEKDERRGALVTMTRDDPQDNFSWPPQSGS